MVQEQLVQYLKVQLAAGVSKEKLTAALKEAGWAGPDIDDSLRALETARTGTTAPVAASPVVKTDRPSVGVSDFYGGSTLKSTVSPANFGTQVKPTAATAASSKASSSSAAEMPKERKPRGVLKVIFAVLLVALILGSVGESAYFFLRMRSLQSNLEASRAESDKVLAQLNAIKSEAEKVPSLQSRIADLEVRVADAERERDAVRGAMSAIEASSTILSDENRRLIEEKESALKNADELKSELTYLVLPTGTTTSTPVVVMLSGSLTKSSMGIYTLTTASGLRVTVKNSKEAKAMEALLPLVGQSVKLGGTHSALVKEVTVTNVNGSVLGVTL